MTLAAWAQVTPAAAATGALLAFLLAQFAVAAIAWGHAAKLCGLIEIARAFVASRGSAPKPATAGPVEPADASADDVPEPVVPALPASPAELTPTAVAPPER